MKEIFIILVIVILLAKFKTPIENALIFVISHGRLKNWNEYVGKRVRNSYVKNYAN